MSKNKNTVKIVIIILLIIMILSCIGIIIFDKINIKKDELVNLDELVNPDELVNLDVNSKEIKEIISPIQFGEVSEDMGYPHVCSGEVLSNEFLQGKLSEGNISTDEIIYFASIFVNTKECSDDKTSECKKIYDSFRNDEDVISDEDLVYFEYFEIEDLKNKVKEIFGPDIANTIKDEDYRKYNLDFPDNWKLSNDETKYYIKSFSGNPGCSQSEIQLDEANQKGDEIYTYWKVSSFGFSFMCPSYYFYHDDDFDIGLSSYKTYVKEKGIIKEHYYYYNGCDEYDGKLFDGLRSIGKATRYKITYKKQSDGKYYIYSGEWE